METASPASPSLQVDSSQLSHQGSQLSTVVTKLYNRSSELIHLIPKAYTLLSVSPYLFHSPTLATTLPLCFYECDFFPYFLSKFPHIRNNMQALSFFVWLISVSVMSSSFIHVVANVKISFLLMAEWYSFVYMYHVFFICSSDDGHLGCFLILASLNNTAMKVHVCSVA